MPSSSPSRILREMRTTHSLWRNPCSPTVYRRNTTRYFRNTSIANITTNAPAWFRSSAEQWSPVFPSQLFSWSIIFLKVVKKTHESGGFGSIGYGCVFKKEEAMKNLLRTHTTAISAQMLHKLANQEGGFKPKKYFSIDRVFRNEAMDATHLCEFHQVRNLVNSASLSLTNRLRISNRPRVPYFVIQFFNSSVK